MESNEGQNPTEELKVFHRKDRMMVVVAMEFGTTYSGYAFSTKEQYLSDATKMPFIWSWAAGKKNVSSVKAPTSVLFDERKHFHSFGNVAEQEYAFLASDDDRKNIHKTWYFFRRFTMLLRNKKIHRQMVIEDETKKPMSAIDVFTAAIEYMKNHCLDYFTRIGALFENNDIHWVLTVPAICSEPTKQFMREAAGQAGIDGELLSIVRENVAALTFIQISQKDITVKSDGTKLQILSEPGVKCMVINLGGGAVDITVHKREEDNILTEIHKATGGALGGTKVDDEFFQMIIRIVGADILDKFRNEHMDDNLDLQQELEVKKRTITCSRTHKATFRVPVSLARTYSMEYKETVQESINKIPEYAGKVTWAGDKLRMDVSIFKDFFKVCSSKLVNHIKELMQKPEIKDTKEFLMVGGISESEMMQDAVKKAFPSVKVMIPQDAGLSVLIGAVIYGHTPLNKFRVAQHAYGINISPPFDSSVHMEDHKVIIDHLHASKKVGSNEGQNPTNEPEVLSDKDGMMLVAAIDFGTTYSGYAFSTKQQFQSEATKISLNQNWPAGASISAKAPTSVLFDERKQFHSFGYVAEQKYWSLAADNDHKNVHKSWYFFRRFKMMLHNKKIHRTMVIEDETKKPMPAITVFTAVIQHMKDRLLDQSSKNGAMFENKDIHWVLTVPAIWSESAKQFMREAAGQAGIDGALLSIALEPEAASIFTQISQKDITIKSDGTKHVLSVPGVKYMVIDLGGGTADITVHKREEDDRLTEVHKATGGAWGGTKVDDEFFQMIIRIIGAPVLEKFRNEHMDNYLDLQQELEVKKRTTIPSMTDKVTFTVPSKLAKAYKKEFKEPVQAAIDQSPKYVGKVTWNSDKLRMDVSVFMDFFKVCSSKLVNHIKDLMQKPEIKGTKVFLMVGGFSESEIMQDAVEKAFPSVNVLIPEDAGLSVLQGAVMYGHAPLIKARVSRYAYGINISPPFDSSYHMEDHKVTVDGIERCRDWFKTYIKEGEIIQVKEPRSRKHISLIPGQREMVLKIFASEQNEVCYTDKEGVTHLGEVVVMLPHSNDRIKVEVTMMFGKTELQVFAKELQTHNIYKAYFDFL